MIFYKKCDIIIKRRYIMYKERNIATSVILTIVTCGIYGLYWLVCLTDEVNREADEKLPAGGTTLLLTIVTCGIYGYYWAYKMGKNVQNISAKNNIEAADNSVLYLVLEIVGLGIVDFCLIQSDLNKLANNGN